MFTENPIATLRTLVRWFLVVVCLFVAVAPTHAASSALNGEMPAFGSVDNFLISPDDRYVVYTADQQTDGAVELYSVPLDGSAPPVRLSGLMPVGSEVDRFTISPDSSRVVYWGDQDTVGLNELYSVPIDGSAMAQKLNGPLVAGGHIHHEFFIAPDSSRVVYLADQEVDGVHELHSVPLDGSAPPEKLNEPLVAGGGVFGLFEISPDSSHVVYVADQDTDDVRELYSVPLAGGAVTRLSGTMAPGGDISLGFLISPDSSRVVYRADQQTNDKFELYSVPLTGGAITKISAPLVADRDTSGNFAISPDSSRVVYRADRDIDDMFELYSVPLTGGASTELNDALVLGGNVVRFTISPDSSRVVYWADQQTDEVGELYSVPLAGGTVTRLNDTLVAGGEVNQFWFFVSPDSNRVVYLADQDTDEVQELYSVPLAGGTVTRLNDTLVAGGKVIQFSISPDSSHVVYTAEQETAGVRELYSVPLAGGEPSVKLNDTLTVHGGVNYPLLSADSSRVVYHADQDTNNVWELYAANLGDRTVGLQSDTITVPEDAGTISVTVTLNSPSVETVAVDYAITSGNATSGDDMTVEGSKIKMDGGTTEATIEIAIVDDTLVEGDETVELTLSNPINATLVGLETVTITIEDNDVEDVPDDVEDVPSTHSIYIPIVQQ